MGGEKQLNPSGNELAQFRFLGASRSFVNADDDDDATTAAVCSVGSSSQPEPRDELMKCFGRKKSVLPNHLLSLSP